MHFRFDSISGKSTIQKTIGFEKGSQLFNIGALYSHIAAHQVKQTTISLLFNHYINKLLFFIKRDISSNNVLNKMTCIAIFAKNNANSKNGEITHVLVGANRLMEHQTLFQQHYQTQFTYQSTENIYISC